MILSNQVKASVLAALLVLTAIMYFSISLYGQTYEETRPLTKIINPDILVNTKKSLPQNAIAPRIWHKYPGQKWRDLQLPVLISNPMGRLGNVMGEYATLLALGRVYGTTVRLHPSMQQQLITIFPNISIPLLPGAIIGADWTTISFLTFINYGKAEAAAAGILGPGRFLLTGYPFEIQLFNTFRQDIIKQFTFAGFLQKQVNAFWKEKVNNSSQVRIGFHVRRTDYVNFIKQFKALIPEDAYYKRAMNYYKDKYADAVFLVASDDMAYVKKAFASYTDVLLTPGKPRELDMALLASCNHSIITLGSYGFWGAYLAGGEVVYPDIKPMATYTFQRDWYEFGQLDFFTPLPPY